MQRWVRPKQSTKLSMPSKDLTSRNMAKRQFINLGTSSWAIAYLSCPPMMWLNHTYGLNETHHIADILFIKKLNKLLVECSHMLALVKSLQYQENQSYSNKTTIELVPLYSGTYTSRLLDIHENKQHLFVKLSALPS